MAFRMDPISQSEVDDLDPILSTRIVVNRETETPHKHPMTVDVLLEPVLTNEGVLYESHLRVAGSVGDTLFNKIWSDLSWRLKLPDSTLREWDHNGNSIGFDYFKVKINVSPEEAHDAVVRFFGRSCLAGVSFYHWPQDCSPLKVRSDGKPVAFAWEVEATVP